MLWKLFLCSAIVTALQKCMTAAFLVGSSSNSRRPRTEQHLAAVNPNIGELWRDITLLVPGEDQTYLPLRLQTASLDSFTKAVEKRGYHLVAQVRAAPPQVLNFIAASAAGIGVQSPDDVQLRNFGVYAIITEATRGRAQVGSRAGPQPTSSTATATSSPQDMRASTQEQPAAEWAVAYLRSNGQRDAQWFRCKQLAFADSDRSLQLTVGLDGVAASATRVVVVQREQRADQQRASSFVLKLAMLRGLVALRGPQDPVTGVLYGKPVQGVVLTRPGSADPKALSILREQGILVAQL